MRGLIILALACLALAGCAQGGPGGACGLTLAGDVPVTLRQSRPLVDVAAGGAHVWFLLDTGATTTLVRQVAVDKLTLPITEGGGYGISGLGGQAAGRVAILNGASVGGMKLPDLKLPVPPDNEAGVQGDIAGVLGMDVMGHYEMDLDLPAARVRFYNGTPCDGEVAALGPGAANIRAGWERQQQLNHLDPRVYVSGTLDGHKLMGLLDTGAQRSALYDDMALELGITRESTAKDPTVLITGIGATRVRAPRHHIAELRFGGAVLRNWEVWVVPRAYPNDSAMILGMDYLATHRMWLAPQRRVALVAAP